MPLKSDKVLKTLRKSSGVRRYGGKDSDPIIMRRSAVRILLNSLLNSKRSRTFIISFSSSDRMSNFGGIMQHRQPGQKGAQPEEVKGGLDARDLIGRFRSKQDIYEYLSHHRKYFPSDNLGHLG